MTKAGMVLRRAVRADIDAEPTIEHLKVRSKHGVAEGIIESAMTKTLAEWDALVAATPDDVPAAPRAVRPSVPEPAPALKVEAENEAAAPPAMPGLAQGVVKFTRKPAKMGDDYILWVPRVYIKNGIVDPHVEYEVYLKPATRKPTIESGREKK